MGRARRNQRDDIRKRKALRRKKMFGESDDIDSSLAKKLLLVRQEYGQEQLSSLNSNDDNDDTNRHKSLDEINGKVDGELVIQSTSDVTLTASTTTEQPPIKVRPMDNIQRMRIRKQERKAKRKAKKNIQA